MSVDPATTLIDPKWYEDHDSLGLTAQYMADEEPRNADRIAHFIEKPHHYEAEYREAKRREVDENQEAPL
jgi:hypothetical protein